MLTLELDLLYIYIYFYNEFNIWFEFSSSLVRTEQKTGLLSIRFIDCLRVLSYGITVRKGMEYGNAVAVVLAIVLASD